jgi:hypothetical protein
MTDDSKYKMDQTARTEIDTVSHLLVKMKSGESHAIDFVPFIGAGVSSSIISSISASNLANQFKCKVAEKKLVPDWIEFKLNKLSQYLDIINDDTFHSSTIIADYINEQVDNHTCTKFINKNLHNPLWILADLPVPVYITTNYDTLLEKYLTNAGKTPQTIVSNWMNWCNEFNGLADNESNKIDLKLINGKVIPDVNNPMVFHLHGVARNPKTMVLSDDHYVNFLVSLQREPSSGEKEVNPVLPDIVKTAIKKDHILFLGYSLEDINLHVLLRAIRVQSNDQSKNGDKGRLFSVQLGFENKSIVKLLLETKVESEPFQNELKALLDDFENITQEYLWERLKEIMIITELSQSVISEYLDEVKIFVRSSMNNPNTKVTWVDIKIFLEYLYYYFNKYTLKGLLLNWLFAFNDNNISDEDLWNVMKENMITSELYQEPIDTYFEKLEAFVRKSLNDLRKNHKDIGTIRENISDFIDDLYFNKGRK